MPVSNNDLLDIAKAFGVAIEGNPSQEAMVARLKQGFGEPRSTRAQRNAFRVALAAAGFALLGAIAGSISAMMAVGSLNHTLDKATQETRASKIAQKQQVIIYEIIEAAARETSDHPQIEPLDFGQIKTRYFSEIQDRNKWGDEIRDEKVDDVTLKNYLLNLVSTGLIFITYPGPKFTIQQSTVNLEIGKADVTLQARRAVLDILFGHTGEYDYDQLYTAVQNELTRLPKKLSLDPIEWRRIVHDLLAQNSIRLEDGIYHSVVKFPKKQADQPPPKK